MDVREALDLRRCAPLQASQPPPTVFDSGHNWGFPRYFEANTRAGALPPVQVSTERQRGWRQRQEPQNLPPRRLAPSYKRRAALALTQLSLRKTPARPRPPL